MCLATLVYAAITSRQVGSTLSEINTIRTGSGQTAAALTSLVGIYSPTERSARMRVERPSSAISRIAAAGLGGRELSFDRVWQSDLFEVREWPLKARLLEIGRIESLLDLPGPLEVRVKFGPQGLEGDVRNQTGLDLADCIIAAGGWVFDVGDMRVGHTAHVRANSSTDRGRASAISRGTAGSESWARKEMLQQLLEYSNAAPSREIWLIGFGRSAIADARTDHSMPRRAMTMVACRISPEPNQPGQRVELHPAFMFFEPAGGEERSLMYDARAGQWLTGRGRASINMIFTPPSAVGCVVPEDAVFEIEISAISHELRMYVMRGGQFEQIHARKSPDGLIRCPLPDPQRCVDDMGAVRIRLEVRPLGVSAATGYAGAYRITDARMSMRGVAQAPSGTSLVGAATRQ